MKDLIIVRGGGDIATGTIYKLVKSGFHVLILEIAHPSAIRRNVAFSEAVYEEKWQVEDMTCHLAHDIKEKSRYNKRYGTDHDRFRTWIYSRGRCRCCDRDDAWTQAWKDHQRRQCYPEHRNSRSDQGLWKRTSDPFPS